MAKMSAQLIGFREVKTALDQVSGGLRGAILADAVLAGANVIVRDARERTPRDTGKLARSITAEVEEKGDTHVTTHIGWHPEAFYGKYQELGTAHHAPQPHLRPAFDAKREEAVRVTAEMIKERLARLSRYQRVS